MALHYTDERPTAPTQPGGALTPGLAALLDQTVERNRKDEIRHHYVPKSFDAGRHHDPLQLPLFTYNDAGDAVGWNGETL